MVPHPRPFPTVADQTRSASMTQAKRPLLDVRPHHIRRDATAIQPVRAA